MERHDLLLLTQEGQDRIIGRVFLPERKLFLKGDSFSIPAIVKRQEEQISGIWDVGFSFPWFEDGVRARCSSTVKDSEIAKIFTPYEIFDRLLPVSPEESILHNKAQSEGGQEVENEYLSCLERIKQLGVQYQIKTGIYGSMGLYLVTGLPYLHRRSDLDITIMSAPPDCMEEFYQKVSETASSYGIKADIEIRVSGVGDIKAQELFSKQLTVVVRGLCSAWLESREKMVNHINDLTVYEGQDNIF